MGRGRRGETVRRRWRRLPDRALHRNEAGVVLGYVHTVVLRKREGASSNDQCQTR